MITSPKNNTKVVVGLSGGVDSAVAALLLKEQGYNVQAIFMQNWTAEASDPYCSIPQDLEDAKNVCEKLDIPFSLINFSNQYWENVFQHFLDEYAAGRTPNPDILCNKEIKFKVFLEHALQQGAEYIATGHYARCLTQENIHHLLRGLDQNKDQSYFLYTLGQEQLSKTLFPLGELTKQEVRKIAQQANLPNYDKKDSTGICFIGERKFKEFLNEFLLNKPGEMVTAGNKVISKHDGLMFYTLGQRKGLKIGGQKDGLEKPWYVVKKDITANKLYVAQDHQHPWLLSEALTTKNVHWIASEPVFPLFCQAQVRYRMAAQDCYVTKNHDFFQVKFSQPQWAITPGQSVVFYLNNECLGGGVIL